MTAGGAEGLRAGVEALAKDRETLAAIFHGTDTAHIHAQTARQLRALLAAQSGPEVVGDGEVKIDNPCVFCEIAAGRSPAQIVARCEGMLAFHPLDPVTEGHLLVVPTEHVQHFMHRPEVTGRVAEFAAQVANHWMGGGDTNLITSAGGYATQTVKHLHFHIVPRSQDDGLLLPWTGLEVTEALETCREQRTDILELQRDPTPAGPRGDAAGAVRRYLEHRARTEHVRGDTDREREWLDALALFDRMGDSDG